MKKLSRRQKIVALAKTNEILRDGVLELDENATISEGDSNGAYVQVWMWVPFDGTNLSKEKRPCVHGHNLGTPAGDLHRRCAREGSI